MKIAQYTRPMNVMVTQEHRDYVDTRAGEPGVSRADVVREALDLLIEQRPVEPAGSVGAQQ